MTETAKKTIWPWEKSVTFFNRAHGDINRNIHADSVKTDWLNFYGALGWAESSNRYSIKNPETSYYGMYQVGSEIASDMSFFNADAGMGGAFLGVKNLSDLLHDPIAQEIFGLMMFSGIPDPSIKNFTSRYGNVEWVASTIGIGKTELKSMLNNEYTTFFGIRKQKYGRCRY